MIERAFDALARAVRNLKYFYVRCRLWARRSGGRHDGRNQDLVIYSDPSFSEAVSAWAQGTAWNEIQFLLATASGRVIDIACGNGSGMLALRDRRQCDTYGCDISLFLLQHATRRGVPGSRLTVSDATRLPYADRAFEFSYSIGSLEHFTEEGIGLMLAESRRVTRKSSFHQIPVSRKGIDEGWLTFGQSYFNNSTDWWLVRFRRVYPNVHVLPSSWEDAISVGRWFVCEIE